MVELCKKEVYGEELVVMSKVEDECDRKGSRGGGKVGPGGRVKYFTLPGW